MKTLFPMAPTTRARLSTFAMLLAVARRVIEGRGHCPVGVARAAMRRVTRRQKQTGRRD